MVVVRGCEEGFVFGVCVCCFLVIVRVILRFIVLGEGGGNIFVVE